MLQLFAQMQESFEPTPTLSTPVAEPTVVEGLDMLTVFSNSWCVVVLLLLFLVVLYFFIQRYIFLGNALREDGTFMNRVKDYLTEGKVESALKACKNMNTPAARVIGKGITVLGRPLPDILQVMDQLKRLEMKRLERKVSLFKLFYVLAICIAVLGALVWGVQVMYLSSIYGEEVWANADKLVPLYCLLGGVAVASLTYLAYYLIANKLSSVDINMEMRVIEFTNFLNKPVA